MKIVSLQSGSNGNCIYVEAGSVRLLIDAGISARQARQRLASRGRDIKQVDALLISHDHSDHTCGMGIFQRLFHLPVYITRRTLLAANARQRLGHLDEFHFFTAGSSIRLGDVTVETIPTPHDSVDGVAFVIDDGQRRVGILTDLGHVFTGLPEIIRSLDAVLLESNYDPKMLADGPYPEPLKRRIRGPGGHLSNDESAELLNATAGGRLQWACLAHLSQQNNEPRLALQTHRRLVGKRLPFFVASRYRASEVLEV